MKKFLFLFTVAMFLSVNSLPAFAGISSLACYSYKSQYTNKRNTIYAVLNGSGGVYNMIWIIRNGVWINKTIPILSGVSGTFEYNKMTLNPGDGIQLCTYSPGQGNQCPPTVRCQ